MKLFLYLPYKLNNNNIIMKRLTIHKTNVLKKDNKIYNTVSFIVTKPEDITNHLRMNTPYSKWYISFLN